MGRGHSGFSWQSFGDGIRWLISGIDIGRATLRHLAWCIARSFRSPAVAGCAWNSGLVIVDHLQKVQAQRH